MFVLCFVVFLLESEKILVFFSKPKRQKRDRKVIDSEVVVAKNCSNNDPPIPCKKLSSFCNRVK